jgi:hypothetical protein
LAIEGDAPAAEGDFGERRANAWPSEDATNQQ